MTFLLTLILVVIFAAEAGGLKSPDEININNPEIELKTNKNLECGSINT